jgi:ArsR family transcriptional regulator
MNELLTGLRACAEPTRLRLLALAERGVFCVMDFTDILGQSQPRLSRHLRLLCESGMLERVREGANVWFALAPTESPPGSLARAVLSRVPEHDPVIAADRRQAARVLSERARAASEVFRRKGADWDEMRALGLAAQSVEDALVTRLGTAPIGRLLDIGTGTGRLLEVLAPRIGAGIGIDASRAMLALARTRLAKPGLGHCAVRLADMYRLPLADASFDAVVLQMVLHYAEDPASALAEAARVLRPGGTLVVVDLAPHDQREEIDRLAHRWPGFADETIDAFLTRAELEPGDMIAIPGPFEVRLWSARRPAAEATETAMPTVRPADIAAAYSTAHFKAV